MSIKRINEFPEGSGSLSNDDVFLFMDDPSGGGTTKKISLSQIAGAIGGGGGGNLSIAVNDINLHNGGVQSAQVLQFDNASKQSVITGPTPASGNSSQRIIIQGQRAQGNGEGGDVYLWGGDSDVNGGDIKIYAGDADNAELGNGGYVNIDAGNGHNQGGQVSISAGNSTLQGGSVNINAGYPSGNVSINTNAGSWAFNTDGTVDLPSSTLNVGLNSLDLKSSVYAKLYYQSGPSGTSDNYIEVPNNNSAAYLWTTYDGTHIENYRANDGTNPSWNHEWHFNNDGNLEIPGNILLNNGTSVATGTFDNGTSGQNGVSLNCAVGYELNWQGGHLKSTNNNGTTASTIYIDSPIQVASGITFSDGSTQTSAGINSNSTIVCKVGEDLAAKYSAAKALTPGGNSLSATNRATLIVMPGNYTVSSPLAIDTNFVDVIGLGSIKLERGAIPAVNLSGGINVTASNVRVKGISVGSDNFTIVGATNQIFEDCTGGDYSFAGGYSRDENDNIVSGVASGSFINCIGGNSSFAGDTMYGGTASGSFINCVGGNSSFASNGYASGTFKNCLGGNYCFGAAEGGSASGIFIDCVGAYASFSSAGGGPASGTFINCVAGDCSFGHMTTASGSFTNCVGGNDSFGGGGYGTASGSFTNCVGGNNSFAGAWESGPSTASGFFNNCSGGNYSFGGSANANGTFINCTGASGSFGGVGGTASGFFKDCSGGDTSFGGYMGTASGAFLKCILTTGSFQTLSSGGKYRLCIDGSYNVINADYVAP